MTCMITKDSKLRLSNILMARFDTVLVMLRSMIWTRIRKRRKREDVIKYVVVGRGVGHQLIIESHLNSRPSTTSTRHMTLGNNVVS